MRPTTLKGQILRLQALGPPIECSVGWGHNYATTKTDGLLWAGTTEEDAGFDEESTLAARDEIGAALLRMLPAMAAAQVLTPRYAGTAPPIVVRCIKRRWGIS